MLKAFRASNSVPAKYEASVYQANQVVTIFIAWKFAASFKQRLCRNLSVGVSSSESSAASVAQVRRSWSVHLSVRRPEGVDGGKCHYGGRDPGSDICAAGVGAPWGRRITRVAICDQ